jgi:hypothetical protein
MLMLRAFLARKNLGTAFTLYERKGERRDVVNA